MDSFIIRIIRRPDDDHDSITGVIEDVDNRCKIGFTSLEELWAILRNTGNKYYNYDNDNKDD